MTYFLGSIHLLIALFFAVHVVRSGRETYWLIILFSFPMLGSAVYFFTIYLPDSRLHHDVRRAANATFKALNPGKELREATRAFDLTPTAQNQMRLASAYLEAGDFDHAAQHYEACLQGPFANDPEILLGAARSRLHNGQGAEATGLLEAIRRQSQDFRPEQTTLLLAQAYALAGRHLDARNEFISAINRFGTVESRVEFAIWALGVGDKDVAIEQNRLIEQAMKHWNNYTRSLHKPLMRRLDSAFAATRKQ